MGRLMYSLRLLLLVMLAGCTFKAPQPPRSLSLNNTEKDQWDTIPTESDDGRFYPYEVWSGDGYPSGFACSQDKGTIVHHYDTDAFFRLNSASIVGRANLGSSTSLDPMFYIAPNYAQIEFGHAGCEGKGRIVTQSAIKAVTLIDANDDRNYPNAWYVDFNMATNSSSDTKEFTSGLFNLYWGGGWSASATSRGAPDMKVWFNYPNPVQMSKLHTLTAGAQEEMLSGLCGLYHRSVERGDYWSVTGFVASITSEGEGDLKSSAAPSEEWAEGESDIQLVLDWGEERDGPCEAVVEGADDDAGYTVGDVYCQQVEKVVSYGPSRCQPGTARLVSTGWKWQHEADAYTIRFEAESGRVGPGAHITEILLGDKDDLLLQGMNNWGELEMNAVMDLGHRPIGAVLGANSGDQWLVKFDCSLPYIERAVPPRAWVVDIDGTQLTVTDIELYEGAAYRGREFRLAGRVETVTVPVKDGAARLAIRDGDQTKEATWNENGEPVLCVEGYCFSASAL